MENNGPVPRKTLFFKRSWWSWMPLSNIQINSEYRPIMIDLNIYLFMWKDFKCGIEEEISSPFENKEAMCGTILQWHGRYANCPIRNWACFGRTRENSLLRRVRKIFRSWESCDGKIRSNNEWIKV